MVLCFSASHKAVVRVSARDVVSSGVHQEEGPLPGSHGCRQDLAPFGLSDWGPQFLAGCWLETSPCSSLFGALHGAPCHITVSEREHLDKEPIGKTKGTTPHNIITEVTSHVLSYPIVRSKSQVPHMFREVRRGQGARRPEGKDSWGSS